MNQTTCQDGKLGVSLLLQDDFKLLKCLYKYIEC